MLALGCGSADAGLQLELGRLEGPGLTASELLIELPDAEGGAGRLRIGALSLGERHWRGLELVCAALTLAEGRIGCRDGRLAGVPELGAAGVELQYDTAAARGRLDIAFANGGHVALRLAADGTLDAELTAVAADRLAGFVPELIAWQPAGRLDGRLRRAGDRVEFSLDLDAGAFSDAAGLHAGEALVARVAGAARIGQGSVDWQARIEWRAGDVFWNPVLVSAPVTLAVQGRLDAQRLAVRSASLEGPGLGMVQARGELDRASGALREGRLDVAGADLAVLVPQFVLPAVAPGQAERWRAAGRVDAALEWAGGRAQSARLSLADAGFSYLGKRVRVGPMSGELAWHRGETREARLRVDGLHWQALDFGAFEIGAQVGADAVRFEPLSLPVLDGAIVVDALAFSHDVQGWRGSGAFHMEPVSMRRLTEALELPVMAGTLSASVPGVSVSPQRIGLDGALLIALFDGYVQATELEVTDPFGLLPRLRAEVVAEHLDLAQLTDTFSFGAVSGFVDARVHGLEMAGWRPLRFDAAVRSSAGDYRKRISQRAVENISALGGSGAVAAIQRSFLRFFDDFGYREIGIACRLRGDVCHMEGLDGAGSADAPFMVVRGGGIPALNVIGYNRRVDWNELIERLQRVTAGDAAPIVQ